MGDVSVIRPRILIAVVTFNSERDIVACLSSLMGQESGLARVVVIDNHSTDHTVERVRESFPSVEILVQADNLGFAPAANVAIQESLQSGCEYLWLFNPDAIARKEALHSLVSAAENHPEVGLFSPVILDGNGKVWFQGGCIDWWRQRAIHRDMKGKPGRGRWEGFLSGCALFMRTEALAAIGPFDERFFLYYEDADLSLRATKAGWGLLVVPESSVVHQERSNLHPKKVYHLVRSGLIFFHKWRGEGLGSGYFFGYAILRRLKCNIEYFVFRRGTAKNVTYAHRDAWKAISAKF